MNIIREIIPTGRQNRPGLPMSPLFITIHDTGNLTADAERHAKYLKNETTKDSWHFTVDENRIYQHLELNENGWHAGDGREGTGNRKSIGIEICMHNGQQDREKAERNTASLVAHLIKTVPSLTAFPDCIKQHNYWNGKDCPQVLRRKTLGWSNFLKMVEDEIKRDETPEWKQSIMNEAGRLGLIDPNHGHHPDDLAEKWFVLAVIINSFKGGK